jgi:hypothetical protein
MLFFIAGNSYLSDSQARTYDIERFNLYAKWFTEPLELLYFFWLDGTTFKVTSYQWDRVSGNPDEILRDIGDDGYNIDTCFFVIHNHLVPTKFSVADKDLYRLMKGHGFRGFFLLYTSRGVFMLRDDDGLD